ncbi:MAG: LysR family transcriptional regulator [Polyangiaceae bacterium]
MNLDDLATFVCVAESGSFTEAARKLRRPKSSVSRAVSRLESEMNVKLIFRTTRQVALTPAGKSLFQRVSENLSALRDSLRDVQREDEAPAGELRITAPNDLGASFVAECVARFSARYPAVHVDVTLTIRKVDLIKEGFDIALRFGKLTDSSLIARKVTTTALNLYASPAYLARHGTPRAPSDLNTDQLVLFRPLSGPTPLTLDNGRQRFVVGPDARIHGDDFSFLRETLRAGAGVGPLPSFLAEPSVASGELVRVLPSFSSEGGELYIVYLPAKQLPTRVVAFRDFVIESLGTSGLTTK